MSKVSLTTLCYMERDGQYLMLHRTAKAHDINKDKWIGIGGHFEDGESPEECLLREVKEETGYTLTRWRFRGIVTFVYHKMPVPDPAAESDGAAKASGLSDDTIVEYMHLFTADDFTGDPVPCDEGELAWVAKAQIPSLNLWEGDRIFLQLLAKDAPFFSLKLVYDAEDRLTQATLDGQSLESF